MKKFLILLFFVATFSVAGYSLTYHYDVNGDGVVTASDVTALYDYMLGNVPGGDQFDVNGDGVVTAADVTALYDSMLGNVPGGSQGGHEWVDLGLPSGTLWATMNVGANSPEEYGDYFAWGETTPKDVYNWSTYKWCMGSVYTMTKYCTKSNYGFVDNKTELDPEDDAATANWGLEWRMPSKDQILELDNNCTKQWTTVNGVYGRLFTSKINGASLFLPAAGCRWNGELNYAGFCSFYWSRTLNSSEPNKAYNLRFNGGGVDWNSSSRSGGFTVRAVRVSQN